MILVTGAAGKTGRAVIAALANHGERVRALIHREEHSQIVLASGADETFIGDMTQSSPLAKACRDIEAVYHICPNVSPDEVEIGRAVIAACTRHGVNKFVYHSVLHPQTRDMPHHWAKLQVEELLFQSGLNYTILQPAAYMQNILGSWTTIVEQGFFSVPYPIETRISMIDLQDVAEVAAKVISDTKHNGAIYELAGPESLSQLEIAEIITSELGDEIQVRQENLDIWQVRMNGSGMGAYQLETLRKMFEYYAKNDFIGSSVILEHLLGHPPTKFEEFVRRFAAEN
jgi:uncharacterized protein YbjT (DUF2867 family)